MSESPAQSVPLRRLCEIESLWDPLPPSRRSDLPVLCKGERGRHHLRKKASRPGICRLELDGVPVQLSESF